jgi:hypothetical protein
MCQLIKPINRLGSDSFCAIHCCKSRSNTNNIGHYSSIEIREFRILSARVLLSLEYMYNSRKKVEEGLSKNTILYRYVEQRKPL